GWSEVDMLQGRPLPPNLPPQNRPNLAANTLNAFFPAESPRFFASLEIPKEIPDGVIELALEEGAYLHGDITLNGFPLEGVEVVARPLGAGQFQGGAMLTATSDAEGKYAIYTPQSDGYSINSIRDFPLPNWSLNFGDKRAQPVGAPNEFEFPQVDLLAGSRNLSGQVVDAEGNPIEGASISCQTPPNKVMVGGYGRTNAEGKFSLVRLPRDSLTFEIKSGRPPNEIRTSVVVDAQQTDITIELP
ncbi:MAG: carboxypeptidase regulatory-like domain-containing protein, partial [Aureliella sp.]